jgi:SAM-dependent methyltransferase
MTKHYTFDQNCRIWSRIASSPLSYSDGDEAEEYILSVLRNAKDVSTSSTELMSAIRDWPSEYHLSRVRHNLLRSFAIKKSDQILELGCGCGAISRYLGETGASVIAVEGSYRRAQIAAERCRDLPNVSIICDNMNEFVADSKFDYVTLIGVLEYARVFIDTEDPVRTCLERARSFLKEDGVLILAIENQLGLKYFNGCAEDHTDIPYFGITDCYGESSPVTFSRGELMLRLSGSGYPNTLFYYPFPDYKLPRMILTSEALNHALLNIEDLLCTMESRDYNGNPYRAFLENRVWPLIARNGLISDLANSFLIFASKGTDVQINIKKTPWLAASYSTERHPAYATETCIVQSPDGTLEVTKECVSPRAIVPQDGVKRFFHHPQAKSVYCCGKLLLAEFQHKMATQGDVLSVIKPWFQFLQEQSAEPDNSKALIPGHYLDCIPRNLICGRNDELFYIDAEWDSEQLIPLTWVVIRGIVDSMSTSKVPECLKGKTMRDLITSLFTACEMTITDSDWLLIDQLEADFQKHVYGRPNHFSYIEFLDSIVGKKKNFYERILDLEEEIKRAEAEIERVKATASWRITKPLRLMPFLLLLLRKVLIKYFKS